MCKWISTAVAVAALLFASAEQAQAGLIPLQVSVTPDAGMYRYTYAVKLPTDAVLRPGDYFTIYDFDGFVPGSATASGSPYSGDWTFSSSPTGPTPAGVGPTDNPSITNLTWTYNGSQIGLNASLGLGNFWALSQYPTTKDSWFTASTGTTSGVTDNNITPTTVPVPSAPPPGVPEPATLLLAGLGLPFAAILRRRKAAIG
jgi:hypothetical protein